LLLKGSALDRGRTNRASISLGSIAFNIRLIMAISLPAVSGASEFGVVPE